MSDIKCPFCGQELTVYEYSAFTNVGFLPCEKCRIEGTKEMWEALIRTRKALDVAVDALKMSRDCAVITSVARGLEPKEDEINIAVTKALEQITTLEQKD